MKIGIVIAAINLWDSYTKRCIDSIKTKHDYRIVLIDNASTDATKEEAGKMVSDTFAHKRNEENWGVQRSWNYGIKDSFEHGADYVLIINNDIILHPEAIDRLTDFFNQNPENVFMATAMDMRAETQPEHLSSIDADSKKDVEISEHPNFSAFMINKECWEKTGEFDELFYPAYFEDNDYHYRIKLAGGKAITLPTAMFYHYGSRTQNEATPTPIVASIMFEGNRTRYKEKWGGEPGQEQYTTPYNDSEKTLKTTKQ